MGSEAMLAFLGRKIAASERQGRLPDGGTGPCITFRDYMEAALYHPELGYYRSGASRVGREGDFYTSAYVGDIMGGQLADWLTGLAADRFPGAEPVEVIDWGGGTGRLGAQMLAAWRKSGATGERFRLTVVDGNPAHLAEAQAALADETEAGRASVMTVEEAQARDWSGGPAIVVANELLDAFPVHRVTRFRGRLQERAVAWEPKERRLVSCLTEPSDPALADWLKRQGVKLANDQTAEIGLDGAAWVEKLASHKLGRAVLVVIDYGDLTGELTGPHRMDGTLLMYERHRAHADPFRHPGEQDMTAHVDFDLVRAAAVRAGWQELWYGTQKRFLVESGVLGKLTEHGIADPFHPLVRRNRAIRQLLLSDGMSELFKVQVWAR